VHSKTFIAHARQYNNMLAFGSVQSTLWENAHKGGPFVYRICGQIYRYVISVENTTSTELRYGQLYYINTEDALRRRDESSKTGGGKFGTYESKIQLFFILDKLIRAENDIAKGYKQMRDICDVEGKKEMGKLPVQDVNLVFETDNLPPRPYAKSLYAKATATEIAAIIVGQGDFTKHSIIIKRQSDHLQCIDGINCRGDAFCYPLLFPRGEATWHPDTIDKYYNERVSECDYYRSMFHIRYDKFNPLFYAGELMQQFVVNSFVKVEESRLNYYRTHQKEIKAEKYSILFDALTNDVEHVGQMGRRIILPSSFEGSPRNLHEHTQDAIALESKYGTPTLFITMTANPNWEEVQNELKPGQTAQNRADIIVRVFHMKLQQLMHDLTETEMFGEHQYYVYRIEFQKRQLPHVHLTLRLKQPWIPRTSAHVDMIVSAEIPDVNIDPKLHNLVTSLMIHGPCGPGYNTDAVCRQNEDGKCKHKFPKKFCEETVVNEDGEITYRRRDNGRCCRAGKHVVDNTWIAEYNPTLTRRYKCHINVVVCHSIMAFKYLFKY
jgi:hypothetical protein